MHNLLQSTISLQKLIALQSLAAIENRALNRQLRETAHNFPSAD